MKTCKWIISWSSYKTQRNAQITVFNSLIVFTWEWLCHKTSWCLTKEDWNTWCTSELMHMLCERPSLVIYSRIHWWLPPNHLKSILSWNQPCAFFHEIMYAPCILSLLECSSHYVSTMLYYVYTVHPVVEGEMHDVMPCCIVDSCIRWPSPSMSGWSDRHQPSSCGREEGRIGRYTAHGLPH